MFKIVALGGSNTFGYPDSKIARDEAYPSQLEALLRAENLDVEVVNSGMPGQRTDQMLAALDAKVPIETTHVIFQPGGNDRMQGVPDQIRNGNIAAIKRALESRGVKVLIWDIKKWQASLGRRATSIISRPRVTESLQKGFCIVS